MTTAAVRALFRPAPGVAYLDAATYGLPPTPTVEALARWRSGEREHSQPELLEQNGPTSAICWLATSGERRGSPSLVSSPRTWLQDGAAACIN